MQGIIVYSTLAWLVSPEGSGRASSGRLRSKRAKRRLRTDSSGEHLMSHVRRTAFVSVLKILHRGWAKLALYSSVWVRKQASTCMDSWRTW